MITIKTFNGFSLNSASYKSIAASAKNPPDASPVFLEQPMSDSIFTGTFNNGTRSVTLTTRVLDLSNREILESQLKEACRPGTSGLLVGTFDDGLDYQLNCVVQSIHINTKYQGIYTILLETGESAWRAVVGDSEEWSVTASGDTKELAVGGYSRTRLNLSITPTTLPDTGWAYQRLYQLVNKAGIDFGLRPWCIELDTAALVTAGKMQADCDDIAVIVDGVETKRWIASPNNAATKIWINLNLAAGYSLALQTAIASSGSISTITLAKTADNQAVINKLPSQGILVHGTEWIEYTGVNTRKYQLTGVTRGVHNTTMQAHASGDTFNWIEHSIYLLYGNASATDPSLTDASYDDTKPLFDLETSSNTLWKYDDGTKYRDPDNPNRTAAWEYSKTATGNVSEVYDESENTEGGDPAMGMEMATWYKGGLLQKEKATFAWSITHAGGISTVSMTGKKYRSSTSWPGTSAAKLQRAASTRRYEDVWTEAQPTAAATWETITQANASITGSPATIRFYFDGILAASLDNQCYFEVLTVELTFVSANQPTGTLLAEASNYLLNVTIENTTNGDQINLLFPMKLNKALVVDSEEYEVTYDGANANASLSLDDESRDVWIRLTPNATNTLAISGDVAKMTVVASWYERRM